MVLESKIALNQAGSAVCPFHADSNPSFSVNKVKQVFHCFGCGVSGDVFRFIELREGLSFRQALDHLAQRGHVPPYRPHPQEAQALELERAAGLVTDWVGRYYHTRLTDDVRQYVTVTRGLPEEFLERFCIGWADGGAAQHVASQAGDGWLPVMRYAGLAREIPNVSSWVAGTQTHRDLLYRRVVFPTLDHTQPAFLSGRAVDPDQAPKYLHQDLRECGGETPLYNEDSLIPGRDGFVVEGPVDVLSLEAWGFPTAGFQGGFRASSLRKINQLKTVGSCLDADRAGQASAMKLAAVVGVQRLRIIVLPSGMDPNDFYRQRSKTEFEDLVAHALNPVEFGLSLLPSDGDPTTTRQALEPLLRLLGSLAPTEAARHLDQFVVPRLKKWSKPALHALYQEVDLYRAGGQVHCPACGTTLHTRRGLQ